MPKVLELPPSFHGSVSIFIQTTTRIKLITNSQIHPNGFFLPTRMRHITKFNPIDESYPSDLFPVTILNHPEIIVHDRNASNGLNGNFPAAGPKS